VSPVKKTNNAPKKVVTTPKPPIKTTSKSSSISKEDIEKIFRELIRKEFAQLGIFLEDKEPMEDNQGIAEPAIKDEVGNQGDFMDIDLVRLKNAKDLLAMKGRVEGVDIQVLADTNANISWMPKIVADELGIEIDTSKTYNINGVSGKGKTLGIARDTLVELQAGCVIKEDMAVVDDYSYREIGLSRPCLRRYNYDVLESREHIPLTCDGKNFFIPIVPDMNRSEEEAEN
jgi:hypothetical protein